MYKCTEINGPGVSGKREGKKKDRSINKIFLCMRRLEVNTNDNNHMRNTKE